MKTWVIGGDSGIGKAIAERLELHPEGSPVSVHATGRRECDVTLPADIAHQIGHSGDLAGVVFSAGINYLDWAEHAHPREVSRVVETNLTGFLFVMNELARWGVGPLRVVVISSDAAVRPMRTSAAYCASKAGLNMAVKCYARELSPKGWVINAIAPGIIEGTGMTEYVDETVPKIRGWSPESARRYEESQTPMARRGTVEEVARVASWLMYSAPDYLNGEIIAVNGGR